MSATVTPDVELNPTDEDIIDEITSHGRASVQLLADVTGKNKTYIGDRVRRMREHGMLVEVAPRLYDTPDQAAEYLNSEE